MKPEVAVIIPNHNNEDQLRNCLISLKTQGFSPLEVAIVDNGSRDRSKETAKAIVPEIRLIENDRNLGFAKAINQGVRSVDVEYVLLLNNDTILEKNFIETLLTSYRSSKSRHPNLIGLAPKMLFSRNKNIIDSIGTGIQPNGSAFNVGIGQLDYGQFDHPTKVFGLCFAAAFIEKRAFEEVGYLDESYFAYYEDVDWCYRANVLGYIFMSCPGAVVYHEHSSTARKILSEDEKYYLIHRNYLRTILKNYYRGNQLWTAKRAFTYIMKMCRSIRVGDTATFWIHAKILLDTLMRSPKFLCQNINLTRKRRVQDPSVWGLSSGRIIQLSSHTFDPSSYSPVVSTDILEEIFGQLASIRSDSTEDYISLSVVNNLRKTRRRQFEVQTAGHIGM